MRKAAWHQNFKKAPEAQRTSPDGIKHDSVEEKERWCKLLMDQRCGVIRSLRRQVIFPLQIDEHRAVLTPTGKVARYTADFVYSRPAVDRDGHPIWVEVIEDHKGFLDQGSAFRMAVFEGIYGKKIHINKR